MQLLEERLRAHIAELGRDGLLRKRRPPQGIDLSSNDYLGLAQHPLIKERMAAAVCAMGAGSTGSRLLRGERDCFTALEQRFDQLESQSCGDAQLLYRYGQRSDGCGRDQRAKPRGEHLGSAVL